MRVFSVLLMACSTMALSQDFPTKSIRFVTGAVGGGSDVIARVIALGLAAPLRQTIIVDNRGSSGLVPIEIVSRAPPDGYTLMVSGGSLWIDPLLERMPYDAVRDFAPVTITNSSPLLLVLHPSVAAKSVKELIVLAKAKPGALNFGSGGGASSAFLAGELFKAMAGVNMTHIPYKGVGPATIDLIAGHLQLIFSNAAAAAPHIKSGKLRVIAVTSEQPSALYPDLPTVAASGLPGFEAGSNTSIFAPSKTPATIVGQLNRELVRFLKTPETKQRFLEMGTEAYGSTPQELAAKIKSEIARWGKLIKNLGIKVE